jgi:hypothetical protein
VFRAARFLIYVLWLNSSSSSAHRPSPPANGTMIEPSREEAIGCLVGRDGCWNQTHWSRLVLIRRVGDDPRAPTQQYSPARMFLLGGLEECAGQRLLRWCCWDQPAHMRGAAAVVCSRTRAASLPTD